jgi:hypothetical protein
VNEHSKASLMPPFHAAVASFDRRSGGAALLSETSRGQEGG